MGDHRASRTRRQPRRLGRRGVSSERRWFGQGRTRALLATGLVFGLGATGTYAYWTDQGTITATTFSSGKLDLTAGTSTGLENLVGTGPNNWDYTAFSIDDMIPGESVSKIIVIGNNGNAPLRFNAKVASSNGDLSNNPNGLQIVVHDNATANAQTGTKAAGNRAGTCSGSSVFSTYVSTTQSGNIFPADIPLPANGNTRSLCVRAVLATSAPNSMMSKSTNVVFTLSATQLSAP